MTETKTESVQRRVPYPGTEGTPTDDPQDLNHMVQIKALIDDLQSILDRFGNTCVYIRRGGLSWGAVALNRRADDEKFGLFDLQAQHDRDMTQRAEQAQRLIADKNELMIKLDGLERFKPTHRHYKGGLYQELMRGKHTETREGLVCYRGSDGQVHFRPAAMFDGKVEIDADIIGMEDVRRFRPLTQDQVEHITKHELVGPAGNA